MRLLRLALGRGRAGRGLRRGGAPLVDPAPARRAAAHPGAPRGGHGGRRWSTSSRAPPGTSGRPTRCSASASPATAELRPLLLPPEFEGHPAAQGVRARVPGGQTLAGREGTGRVGGRRWPSSDPAAGRARPGRVGHHAHPGRRGGVGEGPRGGTPARPAGERPARPAPGARPARTPRVAGTADGPAPADRPAPGAGPADQPASGDGPVADPPAGDRTGQDGGTA